MFYYLFRSSLPIRRKQDRAQILFSSFYWQYDWLTGPTSTLISKKQPERFLLYYALEKSNQGKYKPCIEGNSRKQKSEVAYYLLVLRIFHSYFLLDKPIFRRKTRKFNENALGKREKSEKYQNNLVTPKYVFKIDRKKHITYYLLVGKLNCPIQAQLL